MAQNEVAIEGSSVLDKVLFNLAAIQDGTAPKLVATYTPIAAAPVTDEQGNPVPADAPSDTPMPVYRRDDAALYGPWVFADGAGNLVEGVYYVKGNETKEVVFFTPLNGATQGPFVFDPPPDPAAVLKFDGFNATIVRDSQSNGRLLGGCSTHQAISGERWSVYYRVTLDGIPVVAYDLGHAPMGSAVGDNILSGGTPNPDPTPAYTLTQIAEAVVGLEQGRLNRNGGELYALFAQLIKDKVRPELQKEAQAGGILSMANFSGALEDALYEAGVFNQLINIFSASTIKLLVAYGVVKPSAIPTDEHNPNYWPRRLPDFPWGATG